MMLTRYWIEFEPPDPFDLDEEDSPALPRTCGVTAASLDEALVLIQQAISGGHPLPPVRHVYDNVDTAMLTMWHIGPSSMPPTRRGVWYPPISGTLTDGDRS
jgi:hypothetical protein